jgi:8-oxo-dGTP diphosphatase
MERSFLGDCKKEPRPARPLRIAMEKESIRYTEMMSMKVNLYKLGTIDDSLIKFVVIIGKHQDDWVLSRHRERDTWEFAGGHREIGESLDEAANRELYEETGAKDFSLIPISIYSVTREKQEESFGQLYLSIVDRFDPLPDSEMSEVKTFKEIPDHLTYPLIYPVLIKKVLEY